MSLANDDGERHMFISSCFVGYVFEVRSFERWATFYYHKSLYAHNVCIDMDTRFLAGLLDWIDLAPPTH